MMKTYRMPIMLKDFQDEINRLFERGYHSNDSLKSDNSDLATTDWTPRVDISEYPEHYEICADIPGMEPDEIQLNIDKGTLTIQGDRKMKKEEKEVNYHRTERFSGTFHRQFAFPDTADLNNISAKSKHGVIEIYIPKIKKAETQKVKIKIDA